MEGGDVDGLNQRVSGLDLDDEAEGLSFLPEGGAPVPTVEFRTWTIAGRFLSNKVIKFDIMQRVMAAAWKSAMGVRIVQEGEVFLFHFYHVKDATRIIEEGPWSFDNATLVCKLLDEGEKVLATDLNCAEMWVQVHNLPFGYSSPAILEAIGNFVGGFVKIDVSPIPQTQRPYFRVRVAVDVRRPLRRKMKLTKRDGSVVWVQFQFERLNNFCFFCGVMGHLAKHCRGAVLSSLEPEDYPFDASLRAGGRKKESGLGLPWLRFQDPWEGCGEQVGTSSLVQKVIPEEEVELEVVAKRKRGTEGGAMLGRDLDISMMDGSKNLQAAGSGFQARRGQ
ncbi:unnamed protein product [Cuscuta campestris]|uniref:CCHC-type domain-containing protein n=1 Tax=Cuscuta campestris TaxID=132261 RepID=A0A484LI82_9ASTE|nr:unnamed protein product [Cuscuta campestris]